MQRQWAVLPAPVRARRGRLIALSVSLGKSVLHGAFARARRALNGQKRRVPARAVAFDGVCAPPPSTTPAKHPRPALVCEVRVELSPIATLEKQPSCRICNKLTPLRQYSISISPASFRHMAAEITSRLNMIENLV